MKRAGMERRLYPRFEHALTVKIAANGYDISTCTSNISCIGAYCHIDKYIPPFTKIAIKMNLPLKTTGTNKTTPVECKGVIVRVDDDKENAGFNIAIFFNEIRDVEKHKIMRYISQSFPAQNLSTDTLASLQ